MKMRFLLLFILWPAVLFGQLTQRIETARDIYRVQSGTLTRKGTIDFKIGSIYKSLNRIEKIAPTLTGEDTIYLNIKSNLGDLNWSMKYGLSNKMELSISGLSMFDKSRGLQRYGAGDTRIGLKFGDSNENQRIFYSIEPYLCLTTGFSEGDHLIRDFTIDKTSWGLNGYMDFKFNKGVVVFNGNYYSSGSKIEELLPAEEIFWYPMQNSFQGISRQDRTVRSKQAGFGIGGEINIPFGRRIFGEYRSTIILPDKGESRSIAQTAFGMNIINRENLVIKLGVEKALGSGTNQAGMGYFLNMKFNGIFGGRRDEPRTPPLSEELPALVPGRKPFIRREGVVFSRERSPIKDTVFLIDGSPSMIGRGLDPDNQGDNVLRNVIQFVQTIIDSAEDRSNISLVVFGDKISSLNWRDINESKREDIKNSIRDIPDIITQFADDLETNPKTGDLEKIASGFDQVYKELESFRRGDYNRIHLQRIIVFSDLVNDSNKPWGELRDLQGIQRKYRINSNDFRFLYFVQSNVQGNEKVPNEIISIVEKENGRIYRKTDVSDANMISVDQLRFNNIHRSSMFRYLSQVTKVAVLPFNTKGMAAISDELTKSFESVYDFNEYFTLVPQNKVRQVMRSEGINFSQKIEYTDAQRIGKAVGADYIVIGEVVTFKVDRGGGIYVPYLIGFPKTKIEMAVAISLIDVREGTLSYVDVIRANHSFSRGINFFARNKENKNTHLTALDYQKLQDTLLKKWKDNLRKLMFEDIGFTVE